MNTIEITTIKYPETALLEQFLADAGTSLHSFRYFDKRPLEVIKNHLTTLIALEEGKAIGYAHLDNEDGIVWLGIAVSEAEKGKGIGKKLMEALMKIAEEKHVKKVRLSVDNDNLSAIQLYLNFGFQLLEKKTAISFYEKKFSTD